MSKGYSDTDIRVFRTGASHTVDVTKHIMTVQP